MTTNRLFALCSFALLALAASAQSPEAIRESIRKYPNLGATVCTPYPSAPNTTLADAPKGFKPFYFSLVGRHGSRYAQKHGHFCEVVTVFNRADSLGILTPDGRLLCEEVNKISKAQQGHNGELAELGAEQWHGIACRAYKRFTTIFKNGSVEGKSSDALRCVLSMAAFNSGIKECSPSTRITQQARKTDLWIVRPHHDNPAVSQEAMRIHKEYKTEGAWTASRREWEESHQAHAFISKVTTDKQRFLDECAGKYSSEIARHTYMTLICGENFGLGNRELLNRLFTTEEIYNIYVHNTALWINFGIGRGNDYVEMKQAHMRSLIEDIINKGNEAIKGENPHTANVRFTHDSYVGPLLSAIGYDGCTPQCGEDIERATTSFNHGVVVPMAANLQIVLYRNKAGEVLVRSLINECDATLPIECATAPFYPWGEFCKYMYDNLARFDKAEARILNKTKN